MQTTFFVGLFLLVAAERNLPGVQSAEISSSVISKDVDESTEPESRMLEPKEILHKFENQVQQLNETLQLALKTFCKLGRAVRCGLKSDGSDRDLLEFILRYAEAGQEFQLEQLFLSFVNGTNMTSSEVLQFDAALQTAYNNAGTEMKQQLDPLMVASRSSRSPIITSLASLVRRNTSFSLKTTGIEASAFETFRVHGPEIISEAYNKSLNNVDAILDFAETTFADKPEDRLLAYQTLLNEMSNSGHLGSEQFLRFVFQVKKFHSDSANSTSEATKKGLTSLISNVPRNVRELVFYGDRDDKKCVIANKVYNLKMFATAKYVHAEECSTVCPPKAIWRFKTSDGGKTFHIHTRNSPAKSFSLGKYYSSNLGACTSTAVTPKIHTVEMETAGKESEDLWKILPVEDARYLHFQVLNPTLAGGLMYAERYTAGANQQNKPKALISIPDRSNTVAIEALMEVHCSDA